MKEKVKKIIHDNKKTFGKYLITGSATLAVNNIALAIILITLDDEILELCEIRSSRWTKYSNHQIYNRIFPVSWDKCVRDYHS
ncbi:hypothetical protein KBB41_02960 [Candidatus Curtissbacteria bacterium]|nr:hypothetical protein [Candidatus Curtissbacteria bacterium]